MPQVRAALFGANLGEAKPNREPPVVQTGGSERRHPAMLMTRRVPQVRAAPFGGRVAQVTMGAPREPGLLAWDSGRCSLRRPTRGQDSPGERPNGHLRLRLRQHGAADRAGGTGNRGCPTRASFARVGANLSQTNCSLGDEVLGERDGFRYTAALCPTR